LSQKEGIRQRKGGGETSVGFGRRLSRQRSDFFVKKGTGPAKRSTNKAPKSV